MQPTSARPSPYARGIDRQSPTHLDEEERRDAIGSHDSTESVDDRLSRQGLNRLTTFFRLFAAIPILIVLGTVAGEAWDWSFDNGRETAAAAGGVLYFGPLLTILFRQKYPRWWFDFNLQLVRFSTRIWSYLALMSDKYPSTDEEQWVHLELDYPDVKRDLNRWLPLVKWLLAIPHFIVLLFLGIASAFAVVFAWFAILFTGRYPRGIFAFVQGVMRWGLRVQAYSILLVTDKYPPFRLAA